MKHTPLTLRLALTGLLAGAMAFTATAQQPPPPGPGHGGPGRGGPGRGGPGGPAQLMANLSPEEVGRLEAARQKAEDDATVKSLLEAKKAIDGQLREAMDTAILRADPTVAPILKKVEEARERAEKVRDNIKALSPAEKKTLKEAREAARNDPAVIAAREKMKSARSPEERRAAGQEIRAAMEQAMGKAGPEVKAILDKVGVRSAFGADFGGPPPPPPGY